MFSLQHFSGKDGSGCLRGICLTLCCIALNSNLSAQQSTSFWSGAKNSESLQKNGAQTDYQIREGVMVQISVFNEPELTAGGRVKKDGTIQCPLIGSIKIQGLTQTAAARLIEAEYRKDYLVNPEVNLFVSQFSVQRITILGQVQRPGSHELPSEKDLTILQVLGLAGGGEHRCTAGQTVGVKCDPRRRGSRAGSRDDER